MIVKIRADAVTIVFLFMTEAMNLKKGRTNLVPKRLFFHVLLNGHFRQRASVGTTMAADPPLFDPLFLHIGLAARWTYEHAFFIEHPTLFLHGSLLPKSV
jgi:hypothetical protein